MQYTYTIKFKPTGQMYHGSRTSVEANPDEFWISYFTSSSIVKSLIDEYGPDAFEIIDITEYPNNDAYSAETLFLVEHDCASSDEWFNLSNNNYALPHNSEIVKQRMLNKYGVEHNMQIPEVRENISLVMKEKWKDDDYRNKRKRMFKERHGHEHQMYMKEVKDKIKETCIKKYGVENPAMHDDVKAKIKKTFKQNYGCHPRQTDAVKEKYKETVLEEYGVEHFSKTNIFKDKIKDTWKQKSPEVLEKHKDNSKNVRANDPILECQHCGKFIKNRGLFNRWHNDNCKHNKDRHNYKTTI